MEDFFGQGAVVIGISAADGRRTVEDHAKDAHHLSKHQPPQSPEAAQQRIQALMSAEEKIRHDLESRKPGTNVEKYRSWRHRASGALKHTRRELRFLRRWLEDFSLTDEQRAEKEREKTERQNAADALIRRAAVMAECLTYGEAFTEHRLPDGLEAIQERREHLLHLRQQLDGAFTDINAVGKTHLLFKETISEAKRPLVAIQVAWEKEWAFLRRHIHREYGGDVEWRKVLVHALERAVAEGFVVTRGERKTIARIKQTLEPERASPPFDPT